MCKLKLKMTVEHKFLFLLVKREWLSGSFVCSDSGEQPMSLISVIQLTAMYLCPLAFRISTGHSGASSLAASIARVSGGPSVTQVRAEILL